MPEPYTRALNGNWVEERWGPSSKSFVDHTARSPKIGDHASKWGPALRTETSDPIRGVSASILFCKEPGSYSQSLNTLTLRGSSRGTTEPHVQQYLFGSGKAADLAIPRGTGSISPYATSHLSLTHSLASKANLSPASQTFMASSRASALHAATLSATQASKATSLRPHNNLGSGGSFVGKKITGEFVSECAKNFRTIGLRDTYHSTLNTLKL